MWATIGVPQVIKAYLDEDCRSEFQEIAFEFGRFMDDGIHATHENLYS